MGCSIDRPLTSTQVAALLWPDDPPESARDHLHDATRRGLFPRGVKLPGVGLRWRESVVREWLDQQFARADL